MFHHNTITPPFNFFKDVYILVVGRYLIGDKKNIAVNLFSKLGWELGLYYASYDDFHPDILARMYT